MSYDTLHDRLRGPIRKALKEELKVTNLHALPALKKVIVNVGINRTKMEGKEMQEYIVDCLMRITGQKPVLRPSRMAISNFKIREGMKLQVRVEGINAFNWVNFTGLNLSPSLGATSTFGYVNAQRNLPRDIQLGARFTF